MRIQKKSKKLVLGLGLLGITTIVGTVAASCATVDTNVFKQISTSDFNTQSPVSFQDISTVPNSSVKNLIYGTTAFNNGNYVLTISTSTDLNQYNFLHGGTPSTNSTQWNGDWARGVRFISNNFNSSSQNGYPNGIQFLLYEDSYTGDVNQWNPYSKYPDKTNDNSASQEDKNNSNKLRRNDSSAETYREIFDLIRQTYGSSVTSWLNEANVSAQNPGSQVTTVGIIAFRNVNGVVTPHFFNGAATPAPAPAPADTPASNPAPAPAPASTSSNQSFSIKNQAIAVSTSFIDFLNGVYR
ncbi:DUF6856 family protein [[Mycoplasma] testudinis]|uniref:DUF6856 family protein n=1 Tax=[Mycoplasma] testudinis TaxID=33924 RepID=UPI000484E378|nr:hypothetical protein [[Mycoplasma] testudinis]